MNILYILIPLAILFIAAYVTMVVLILGYAMRPERVTDEERRIVAEEERKIDPVLFDMPFEELTLKSDFGYKIYARAYIKAPKSQNYVVIVHGHNSSSMGMLGYMKIFADLGYNVIIPDNRYSARTGGNFISFGKYENHDVIKCIEYIYSIKPDAKIGIMGESMGGAIALMVAAKRHDIKFCISYCAFSSMDAAIKDRIKKHFWPAKICLPLTRFVLRYKYGLKTRAIGPIYSAENVKCPTLVMHSKGDNEVYYYHHELIMQKLKDAKLVSFETAEHARAYTDNPDKFKGAIKELLEEAI